MDFFCYNKSMNKTDSVNFQHQIDKAVRGLINFEPEKIILFGSFARGDSHSGSDIDILVIKKGLKNKSMFQRRRQLDRFLEFGLPVETVVFTPSEIKERIKQNDYFLEDALKEGKILYEKK